MLFKLPESLICSLLMRWVTLHDMTMLDKGCCNEVERIVFLTVLSSPSFEFEPRESVNSNLKIKWIGIRQVVLQNIRIFVENGEKLNIDIMKWTKLRSLSCSANGVVDGQRFDFCWKKVIKNNPRLIQLNIGQIEDPVSIFDFIAENARKLTNLSVGICRVSLEKRQLCLYFLESVLRNCKSLRSIKISSEGNHCGELRFRRNLHQEVFIALDNIEYITISDLTRDLKFITDCNLVSFRVERNPRDDNAARIYNLCFLEKLQSLGSVREVKMWGITFTEVQHLMRCNPDLRRLEVGVSDLEVANETYKGTFSNQNHKLISLKVSHNYTRHNIKCYMSVFAGNEILEACPQLINFDFQLDADTKYLIRQSISLGDTIFWL